MIKLTLNEIIKVVKKKSFFIMLLVMIGYIIFTNLIYKSIYSLNNEINDYEILEDDSDNGDNVDYQTKKEINTLANKYSKGSWQYNYILDNAYNYIYEIKSYELGLDEDQELYEENKKNYDLFIQKIEKDDWKAIVKDEKKQYEEQLDSLDGREKEELKINIDGLNWRLEKNISFADSEMNNILENYINLKTELLGYDDVDELSNNDKQTYYDLKENYLINEYSLKNNVNIGESSNARTVLVNFIDEYSLFILIMIFVVAGPIMSSEYNNGTIKLLLVRPYSRIKILLSKYFTVLITILVTILFAFLVQMLVGSIILGFDSFNIPVGVYNTVNDSLETYNVFAYTGLSILGHLPYFILIASLTFMVSTLFSSTAIATIVGFVASFLGDLFAIFTTTATSVEKWWLKYIFSFNWDLTPYIFHKVPMLSNLTLNFSLMICLIYLLIILIPTFIIFKRKDINNV